MKRARRRDITKMAVRFRYRFDGQVRKLCLRPKQEIRLSLSGPTEEGWHAEAVTLRLEGRNIVEEYLVEGKDCDGYTCQAGTRICSVMDRAAIRPMRRLGERRDRASFPRFVSVDEENYDAYAEAMGY